MFFDPLSLPKVEIAEWLTRGSDENDIGPVLVRRTAQVNWRPVNAFENDSES